MAIGWLCGRRPETAPLRGIEPMGKRRALSPLLCAGIAQPKLTGHLYSSTVPAPASPSSRVINVQAFKSRGEMLRLRMLCPVRICTCLCSHQDLRLSASGKTLVVRARYSPRYSPSELLLPAWQISKQISDSQLSPIPTQYYNCLAHSY